MDFASIYYLGITILLFAIFAVIVARTYHPKRKEMGERPKYRMMEDESESGKEKGHGKGAGRKEDGDARKQ